MRFVGCLAATRVVVVIQAHLHAPHMTANVELLGRHGLINGILWVPMPRWRPIALLFISIIRCTGL